MKKNNFLALLITMLCTVVLCFALAGCGETDSFSGDWELESIEDSSMGEIDVSVLKQVNMDVTMTLNEDGSAVFVLFGTTIDGVWEATNATSMTLTLAGEGNMQFVLADGKLVSNTDQNTMTFVRVPAV